MVATEKAGGKSKGDKPGEYTHNRYTSRARSDRRIDALGCWCAEAAPALWAGVGLGVAFGLYDRSPPPPAPELLAPNREASDEAPCDAELNPNGLAPPSAPASA
jgi:hypothetical protein